MKGGLEKDGQGGEGEEIASTRRGGPAGILIGFPSEDDWFEYRLEHDPRFVRRIEAARRSVQKGQGVKFEDAGWS